MRNLRVSRPAGLPAAVAGIFSGLRFRISRSLAASAAKVVVMLLTASLAALAARAAAHYQLLISFGAPDVSGQNPEAPLIQGSDGALYGTTYYGGASNVGAVFKLNQDGTGYRVLHSFAGFAASDGERPLAGLVEGGDGALYGTTKNGGSNDVGTIFKLNKDGSAYAVLLHFGAPGDGLNPYAGLVQATDGVLYGTTYAGGTNGRGTVFRLNQNGSGYGVRVQFGAPGDGRYPSAGLVEGSDGALYGTTQVGGMEGAGTVFKLNKDAAADSVLHSFSPFGDGQLPLAGVVEGSDGSLYGTTYYGGSNNVGTVFKLNKDASGYRVLLQFGAAGDGQLPWAGVVEGSDGALYGTTQYGGSDDLGTLFKLITDGSGYRILSSFSNSGGDGQRPQGGLTKSSAGAFYGTTSGGGDFDLGTVFRLLPPETPDMIGVNVADGAAQVSFAGESGYQYQVLRSTDLSNWSLLTTITMPLAGVYTNADNSPPIPGAYYRAAWVP